MTMPTLPGGYPLAWPNPNAAAWTRTPAATPSWDADRLLQNPAKDNFLGQRVHQRDTRPGQDHRQAPANWQLLGQLVQIGMKEQVVMHERRGGDEDNPQGDGQAGSIHPADPQPADRTAKRPDDCDDRRVEKERCQEVPRPAGQRRDESGQG